MASLKTVMDAMANQFEGFQTMMKTTLDDFEEWRSMMDTSLGMLLHHMKEMTMWVTRLEARLPQALGI